MSFFIKGLRYYKSLRLEETYYKSFKESKSPAENKTAKHPNVNVTIYSY